MICLFSSTLGQKKNDENITCKMICLFSPQDKNSNIKIFGIDKVKVVIFNLFSQAFFPPSSIFESKNKICNKRNNFSYSMIHIIIPKLKLYSNNTKIFLMQYYTKTIFFYSITVLVSYSNNTVIFPTFHKKIKFLSLVIFHIIPI